MKRLLIAVLWLAGAAFAQEDPAIALLKSDAPLRDKAEACRALARLGTKQAVPALASLLTDESLSHMARYALEPIPDPAADTALREALGQVKGRLLVGIIHSLGVRKDTQAIEPLARFLADPDLSVAQAAARAMGKIGAAALPAIEQALSSAAPASQPALCEGLFRCAESMPAADAAALYDKVRRLPNLPHHVRVAALWGIVRNRGAESVPLLLDCLRTQSYVPAADAIRMLWDLPGAGVTRVLTGELAGANPETQILLLQALGRRGDATAAPAIVPLAQSGIATRRIAALHSLAQLGDPASIPVLTALVKDADSAVSGAALAGLIGFPGKEADAAMVSLLSDTESKRRIAIMDAAAQRRVAAAIPALLKAAAESDTTVASASFQALAELASAAQLSGAVDALLASKAVAAAEAALSAICARESDPATCADQLLAGLAKSQGEPRLALLRVLGSLGGPKALAAVREASSESDTSAKETALRVLCDWPGVEALPDLAKIAQTTPDARFKVLAFRGQLRLIPLQNVPDAQKVSQLVELLPLLERQEEKRLALATLRTLPTPDALALVMPYLASEELKEEASDAAVAIAEKIVDRYPAEVAKAMRQVKTSNQQLAERAKQLLARIPTGTGEEGFISIFNGRDLSGWSSKPGWWTVQEGALTSESTPDKPCKECNYLIWRGGQPTDFELRADFKLSLEGNSGIQIRSEERPDWDTYGYQADMTGNGELVGFVYHHSRGLIAGRGEKAVFAADGAKTTERLGDPADLLKHFKQGDWNTYRVVCRGPNITLHVNGVLMCEITDHHATQAAARGIIALQMHPGPPMKVQFKNIRLKELK